jgi:hypothetical protein
MPVKQAEMSSWRRVERVGEVEVGGCRVVVGVLDFIDIFEMRGRCWRSKLAAREHGAGIATGKHQPAGVNVKVPQRP